jgi:hypothetical protein
MGRGQPIDGRHMSGRRPPCTFMTHSIPGRHRYAFEIWWPSNLISPAAEDFGCAHFPRISGCGFSKEQVGQSAEHNGIALDAHAFEREHVRRLARSWLGLSEES